jgi:8-oxo-dGTP pyrophosphatase MutT (NUDIX family)
MIKQLPVTLNGYRKDELRTQFAALCYRRRAGKLQILLITSRRSRRWIVPKGWPMDGRTPEACALQEAWEEAGVHGRASGPCIGVYTYEKRRSDEDDLSCLVMLYPVEVKSLSKRFPEADERNRRWVSRKEAARLVAEADLAGLIRNFEPEG